MDAYIHHIENLNPAIFVTFVSENFVKLGFFWCTSVETWSTYEELHKPGSWAHG